MTSTSKRRWPVVVFLVCASIAVYVVYQSRPVTPPDGDGVFQDLSGWLGPVRDRGYHIKFPEFDLSHPFEAQYRLSRLTNVGLQCGLYLVLIDTRGEWPMGRDHSKVGGRIALRLSKTDGKDVVHVDGPLGKYTWWGFKIKYGLYKEDWGSHFYPDISESYTLKVIYEPAPELSGIKGHVYLDTGAKYSGGPFR